MEEVLGKSSLEERGVLFLTLVSNGHTVLRDKKERIKVVGEAIDLPETEVVTFHIGGNQFLEAVQLLESDRQHRAGEDGLWTF
jgi:hypothetical protein